MQSKYLHAIVLVLEICSFDNKRIINGSRLQKVLILKINNAYFFSFETLTSLGINPKDLHRVMFAYVVKNHSKIVYFYNKCVKKYLT